MIVKKLPETATNVVEYEVRKNTIDFEDGELSFNVSKREKDEDVTIDICRDYRGDLVMGASAGDKYVAQLFIPAREYTEEESEEGSVLVPVPFDINKCILTLWEEV